MRKLFAYLKSLDKDAQERFAASCKTSIGYLFKAISAKQKLGTELSVLIEQNSGGAVKRRDLHPDDFLAFWPELAEREAA